MSGIVGWSTVSGSSGMTVTTAHRRQATGIGVTVT
jgi:hypothetical protein